MSEPDVEYWSNDHRVLRRRIIDLKALRDRLTEQLEGEIKLMGRIAKLKAENERLSDNIDKAFEAGYIAHREGEEYLHAWKKYCGVKE